MKPTSKGATVPVSPSVKDKVKSVQNGLCEASFIVYFLRGILDKATSSGDGVELPPHECAGLIHVMDDLVNRLETMLSDLEDAVVGHE